MHCEWVYFMYDSTAVHMKKRMASRNELILQEKTELTNELECRLTDIYIRRFKKNEILYWN
jgi:hypothetical protein